MSDIEPASRITTDPARLGGKPCIRELRIPVAQILSDLAHGAGWEDILAACPDLDADDISICLLYAADQLKETRP